MCFRSVRMWPCMLRHCKETSNDVYVELVTSMWRITEGVYVQIKPNHSDFSLLHHHQPTSISFQSPELYCFNISKGSFFNRQSRLVCTAVRLDSELAKQTACWPQCTADTHALVWLPDRWLFSARGVVNYRPRGSSLVDGEGRGWDGRDSLKGEL